MDVVQVQLEVPKESKEVVDLVKKIIEQVKDGVQVDDIMQIIPELSNAISGVEKVGDEMKSAKRNDLIAYAGKVIADAIVPAE